MTCYCNGSGSENNPIIVWTACFLWLISIFSIAVSSILFICIHNILVCTGTDFINAIVFLSGCVMLPANLHMVYSIAQNKRICAKGKVGFCPLWTCILWILLVNVVGFVLCIRRLWIGEKLVEMRIIQSMASYRFARQYKQFIDNLQWSLKCCGLVSYKDWFKHDWYDKTRDYDWKPSPRKRYMKSFSNSDSVPLSCCKSGSCIPNYLIELGTSSINEKGCGVSVHRLIKIYVHVQMTIFVIVIFMELLILWFVIKSNRKCCHGKKCTPTPEECDVRQLMQVKGNFYPSSESYINPAGESNESSA